VVAIAVEMNAPSPVVTRTMCPARGTLSIKEIVGLRRAAGLPGALELWVASVPGDHAVQAEQRFERESATGAYLAETAVTSRTSQLGPIVMDAATERCGLTDGPNHDMCDLSASTEALGLRSGAAKVLAPRRGRGLRF